MQELLDGLDFILNTFLKNEPLYPRTLMASVTIALGKGQRVVYDKNTTISYFQGACRQGCSIAAYPKYEDLIEYGLLPKLKPIQLFIDLDLSSFEKDKAKLDAAALYDTLNTVEQYLNGGVATIP